MRHSRTYSFPTLEARPAEFKEAWGTDHPALEGLEARHWPLPRGLCGGGVEVDGRELPERRACQTRHDHRRRRARARRKGKEAPLHSIQAGAIPLRDEITSGHTRASARVPVAHCALAPWQKERDP